MKMLMRTSLGDLYADALFKTEHSYSVKVTEHPVQSGASVTDHAMVEPDEVKMEIGFSDADESAVSDHCLTAVSTLREVMRMREPVTVITRLRSYPGMVITAMSVPDDYSTMNAAKISLQLKEVRIVTTATVAIQGLVSSNKNSSAAASTPTPAKTEEKKDDKNSSAMNNNKNVFGDAVSTFFGWLGFGSKSGKTAQTQTSNKNTSEPSPGLEERLRNEANRN